MFFWTRDFGRMFHVKQFLETGFTWESMRCEAVFHVPDRVIRHETAAKSPSFARLSA